MAIFMMEVSRSSRTGSWGPAWTLTHICWSHHQHHHKSILQHTHFSAPVTLAKTPIFCARTQWYLWWVHTCTPGHNSHRILYQTEPCDDPKVPDQQGSATPTDGCKCSCRSAVSSKCSPGPGQFQTGRKMLYFIFAPEPCPNRYQTPDASAQASTLLSPDLMLKLLCALSSLKGCHMESTRYWMNFTGSQCSCSRRDLVQYN